MDWMIVENPQDGEERYLVDGVKVQDLRRPVKPDSEQEEQKDESTD